MTPDEPYETPFQIDDERQEPEAVELADDAEIEASTDPYDSGAEVIEPDVVEAKQAWEHDPKMAELAEPFVGQWNTLISTTNWEKGEIIHNWRQALIDSGAPATEHSDDAWARRVGGVTAPHVGRLRRVFDRFGSTYNTYEGLYWSHFLAALDWDDAAMWLEGAVQESWSVSGMREKRWEATGAVESQRPTLSQIIEVDTDEDVVLPAQGGGRTKEYGDEPDGVGAGPRYEDPDFGDTEEFSSLESNKPKGESHGAEVEDPDQPASQPFAGLPELPDDLADAIESLKLSVLRHKTNKWADVDAETVQRYLDAIGILMRS
ncbi:hypothetical protein [Novipirellula artificiosorum]|uniref:Uncharacterized protein n=1 Tax=Novipirellula artificiosorum TaxID=2528016 RepID=A0A5C6E5S1_9BACT|nr:hypothetical protein [Novipirellula artificiosorum]TWU42826.1 hypothetical protein Poly41_11270 [Novipirellula artificiosorum]